jgi:DNA-binding transcriptional ArsR family regulator
MAMVIDAESVAHFAALLADRSRAAMCLLLLDGRAWTVGELARQVGVKPSTASEHVTQLVAGGVLAEERQGRHRYVRLADAEVARLVEDVAAVAGVPDRAPSSLRALRVRDELAAARTCYDHLAGRLGVAVFDAMTVRQLLETDAGLTLTPTGLAWFTELGCDVDTLRAARRPLVRTCLDWTERRPHLAGATGAALLRQLRTRSWVTAGRDPRAIRLTQAGRSGLSDLLGLDAAALG